MADARPALTLFGHQTVAQKKVIGYLPTWANFPNIINTLDLSKLTHVNIAFANPNTGGGPSASSIATVVNVAHSRNVKVFISIGGAGASTGPAYQAMLGNTTSMTNFVNTLVQYTLTHNLDGNRRRHRRGCIER